ncbi:MAG: RNA-binding protein [Planctomycetes bacterium]|nr:RNA-binding protein [Planctomycetota bacterium]
MAHRAYVGNLPFSFAKADLENLFAAHGTVRSAEIIIDRETGRSRGFGFVELETGEQLQAAIAGLNGKPLSGRSLTVTEAREREARAPGGPPRDFGAARGPASPAPFSRPPSERSAGPGGGAPPAGPSRSKPERDSDRGSRRGKGMDDYDRNDKSWRRGKSDGWE